MKRHQKIIVFIITKKILIIIDYNIFIGNIFIIFVFIRIVNIIIIYQNNIDGTFVDAQETSETGEAKHPLYRAMYQNEAGDLWTVYLIGNQFFANPASYNLESDLGIETLVSESNKLVSYNMNTNRYYVTEPKPDAVRVIVVPEINASELEKLTVEEIDKQ